MLCLNSSELDLPAYLGDLPEITQERPEKFLAPFRSHQNIATRFMEGLPTSGLI